jgi:glutamate 5-kinase
MLQAVAAVGQGQLMRAFHDTFARRGIKVAQVLLTRDAFEDRTRYLNIRNTLRALGECGALPIINENDAVAVDEIRFGDNDIISALVANMIGADVVVFLTNVDGVLEDGRVLDVIERVDEKAMLLAGAGRSKLGSGGMASKLYAASLVTRAGEVAVVANARRANVLTRLLAGERVGTVFVPADRKMSSRRRWIGQASKPVGKIFVDAGAAKALTQRGKSLLPSGVVAVAGSFEKGATVAVIDPAGKQIARGLTNYSADQIEQIKGLKTTQIAKVLGDKPYDEVIHRNNMTMG